MSKANLNSFLEQLSCKMAANSMADLADQDLIEQALVVPNEAIFWAIVSRHGAMVYRVCWRVLQQNQDAEDAFQATFLILAQKLRSVRQYASLASWLHGVAHRVALKTKARSSTRLRHEQQLASSLKETVSVTPADEVTWRELRSIIDDELGKLPERWRLPLILCYLEGRTQDEASKELGWSKNTLRTRLDEARNALGRRLTKRGFACSTVFSGVLFSDCTISAALSETLISSVVQAASRIANGQSANKVVSIEIANLIEGVSKVMVTKMVKYISIMICGLLVLGGLAIDAKQPDSKSNKSVDTKQPVQQNKTNVKEEDQPADPQMEFDEKLAKEKKFVVVGKVMSADGKTPMEGVDVWASAGHGSLFVTGETKTDKNGQFRLVFSAGLLTKGGPGGVAIVSVTKPGWHSWYSGTRPQYILSSKPLPEKDVSKDYTNLVTGTPRRLEFRMEPAASMKAKLVDENGKPMVNTWIWLTGDKLPPGAGVIASTHTDANGMFVVGDVPRQRLRLVIRHPTEEREDIELGSIQFRDPVEYEVLATIHQCSPKETHTSLKVIRLKDR